jgi:hypothetical protein
MHQGMHGLMCVPLSPPPQPGFEEELGTPKGAAHSTAYNAQVSRASAFLSVLLHKGASLLLLPGLVSPKNATMCASVCVCVRVCVCVYRGQVREATLRFAMVGHLQHPPPAFADVVVRARPHAWGVG